ncbi:XdhC family protein [Rhodoferax sp.]|uniref:XdhC family protein n=1 Tax=Rhodoferax sp. TaxID=50421 RepID=UPI0027304914|nr:XdhC/CoxI family protein [Rhodoferax sp.]MDP1531053.1 XdhC family protein [Rhodoferax sp.]MDP1945070.1 XdhC family protein [Rhodoferax sp.]MDP2442326.1 XdhC family protein [Rhodoferax sp.]MDZ4208190.1 XdhC/CoxI family protein [Rhodoferax sp.]
MESLDLRVLADALEWRHAGHAVTLVTVVQTWGSAPRPPGSLLAVRDDGVVSGSVSGGCVEDDLIARTKARIRQADGRVPGLEKPVMMAYGVSQEEADRFGLPCGGSLRLVQEPLLDTSWVAQLLARTAAHELVARTLTLATGTVQLTPAVRGHAMQFDGSTLTTVFGPKWRLLLIGAGQLSQAVAQIAVMLDFDVLVCDPREEYAAVLMAGMPGARRIEGMPDDVVRELVPDAHTAIVALTHDPKLDDMALLEALQSNAFYVGALGSRRNQEARKRRLAEHFDVSAEALARLHGPVGLALGAKTPAEIAVSIVAEIVQVKNKVAAFTVTAPENDCVTL